MKKNLSTILIVIVFIIGLSVMLYPTISNWYNEQVSSYAIAAYQEAIADISDEEYEAMFEEAREFNSSLTSSIGTFISGSAQDEDYQSIFDLYDGMMGYLVIDEIDVYLPIYHGTSSAVLQKGIGHLEGSYLPTGDIGNNTVLTGHTGLPSAELLTDLVDLEIGDTFELDILNKTFVYEIFNIVVVEPEEVEALQAIEGKDVVTLVTCTPYGVNSHRLLVQGEQIEVITVDQESDAQAGEKEESVSIWSVIPKYTIVPIILIILVLIYLKISSARRKSKRKKLENRFN